MNSTLKTQFTFTVALAACLCCATDSLFAQQWPGLRGEKGIGIASTGDGLLTKTSDVEFKVRWKVKIGSGYSSVIVANDRVVAMFSEGGKDYIGCFGNESGKRFWQQEIGPRFKGENGSFDGPISTPIAVGGRVYAFSPLGKLFCFQLDTGDEIWSREIAKELKVKKPLYGFASSPVIVDRTLVLQLGGKDQSLVGLNIADGTSKWAVSTDKIDSQSPTVVDLQGKTVVLATGKTNLIGVDPATGKLLFKHAHGAGNGGSMVPVMIAPDQVLLTLDDAFSRAFSIQTTDDGKHSVSQVWQDRSIKNTYNIPVLHEEHVYGFSTRILTCIDRETGRAVWKQRKPGDGFLIVVDGHLVISTKKGSLYLSKASPDGYKEIDRHQVFNDLVWSVPAFSQDAVYVRSLGELARVDIVPRNAAVAAATKSTVPMSATVKSFLSNIKNANNADAKRAVVDEFFAKHPVMPFTEGKVAHFFYRGQGKDVAVSGDAFGSRQEKKMTAIDGTNLFHHSLELPEDQRMNYVFFVDYKPTVDPFNPRQITSSVYAGEMEFAVRLRTAPKLKMSWFGMPKWKQPSYLSNWPEKLAGKMTSHTVKSKETGGREMKFPVYLPPSYDEAGKRFPVAYIFDGQNAIKNELHKAADKMFSDKTTGETILVFIDARRPTFPKILAETVVPSIDQGLKTIAKREARVCVGFGFGAAMPLMTAANHNDIFGAVSADSPLVFDDEQRMLKQAIEKIEKPTKFRLSWGRYEMFNPDENWDMRKTAAKVATELKDNAQLEVSGGMANDSTDWSSWRNRYHEIFDLVK